MRYDYDHRSRRGQPPHSQLDRRRQLTLDPSPVFASRFKQAHLFFFQAEDGIRDWSVTGVQTCALPISPGAAIRGEQFGPGSGVSGVAHDPNAYGTRSLNMAGSHGNGAAGYFSGLNNSGVVGVSANSSSYGLYGQNTGAGAGVYGQSASGMGIRAQGGGSGPALRATNTGTGPAGAFVAGGGTPPFTVNSQTKVTNLNADRV